MGSKKHSPNRGEKNGGANTYVASSKGAPPEPNRNPAQRLRIGKEEGASGHGAFGVSRKCSAARFF